MSGLTEQGTMRFAVNDIDPDHGHTHRDCYPEPLILERYGAIDSQNKSRYRRYGMPYDDYDNE